MVVYCSHYNKAIEISNIYTPIGFVAEVYEPLTLRLDKKEIEYCTMTEAELNADLEVKKMRPKIIGTVSLKNHNSLHESAWLYRLAIDPEYPFNRVSKPLIIAALKHAHENKMYTCEVLKNIKPLVPIIVIHSYYFNRPFRWNVMKISENFS